MKKTVALMAVVGLVAGSVLAQELANTTFGKLSGNEIQAKKIVLDGTTLSATKSTTGVTNVTALTATLTATVTPQAPAAVTPTITVAGTLVTNTIVYKDGSDAILTNTIIYVSAVPTATSSALPVFLTNATATVAGVATNVAVQR